MVTAAVLAAACFLWLLWSGMIPNGRTDGKPAFPVLSPINMAVSQLNAAYKDRLADLQDGDYHEIQFQGQGPDWHSILAVFACKISQGSEAMELSSLNEDQAGLLEQVFWDMVLLSPRLERIEGENYSEESLFLSAGTRSPEEMASVYNFTGAQKKALSALLAHPEITDRWLCDLTSQTPEAAALLSALPGDLSPERRAVVEVACSLVGKVNYFWGGKSRVLGWDSRWGGVRKVTASGSVSSGLYRPYGLDCSGFVDWVFFNASAGQYLISQGGGARAQHKACQDISWEDALPGDLAFYPEVNTSASWEVGTARAIPWSSIVPAEPTTWSSPPPVTFQCWPVRCISAEPCLYRNPLERSVWNRSSFFSYGIYIKKPVQTHQILL